MAIYINTDIVPDRHTAQAAGINASRKYILRHFCHTRITELRTAENSDLVVSFVVAEGNTTRESGTWDQVPREGSRGQRHDNRV